MSKPNDALVEMTRRGVNRTIGETRAKFRFARELRDEAKRMRQLARKVCRKYGFAEELEILKGLRP